MIRFWPIVLVFILCGCQDRDNRDQAAADADAGIVASIGLLQNLGNHAAQPAIDILVGARKYLAPAADVPHSEWPAPLMAPFQIVENPAKYAESAPPEPQPWGAGVWAGLTTAGTVALFLSKRLLPLVPGIGGPIQSLIGTIADVAWNLTAHADQKAADKAKDDVASAAQAAQPILETLRAIPPESLPPELVRLLNSQEVARGLAILAGTKSESGST
jgi:hypothetical protein